MPTFQGNTVYSPLADELVKNAKELGEVFADENLSVPLTVYTGSGRTPKTRISTGAKGVHEAFVTQNAYVVWTRWPLAGGETFVFRMWALEVTQLLDQAAGAIAQAARSATAAEAAANAALVAQKAAADLKTVQINATQLFDESGMKIKEALLPAVKAMIASGSDNNGSWIQTDPDDPATKTYVASKAEVTAAVQSAGAVAPQPQTLAMRDASGRVQVGSPVNGADAVNKTTLETHTQTVVLQGLTGTPMSVYWNPADRKYHYNSPTGAVVSGANRPAGRPLWWFFGPDPADVAALTKANYAGEALKVADQDTFWEAS